MNLARFDFVSIQLAVFCAQTGNLTAAAQRSNLVLAAASRRIRELEHALGAPLFVRHSRGLATTEAGKIFVRHGLAMLQSMEHVALEIADAQRGLSRRIALAASTAAITQFLPPLLARYAAENVSLQIDVEELVSQAVVSALREGQSDIGVFVEGVDERGLIVTEFRGDELVMILPRKHRLAGSAPIAFAELLDETWISLNPGAALLEQQQNAALAAGRTLKLRTQVRSFDAVGHLVAAQLGVALLPKIAALPIARAMKLGWRPLADSWAKRQLRVAIRPDADEQIIRFRNFLKPPSQNAKARSAKKK
jgi:DNA-binding transcriptional LysR family regulator